MTLLDAAAGQPFDVRVESPENGNSVICVSGEIDMATAPRLDDALLSCGQSQDVLIDLADVTFFDSSALKVLVRNAKKLSAAGYQIRLRGLSDSQRTIVRITGLNDVLNVSDAS